MPEKPARLETIVMDGREVRLHVIEAAHKSLAVPSVRLPVILLHGLGCSSDAWQPAMRCLAQRRLSCTIYVPDLPGFGCSPGPREALGMDDLAEWLARLMEMLGVTRAHLAGNSMGCQVALALTRRHPERVGGLVLVGPTVGEQYIPFWRYCVGLLLDGFREPLLYNAVLMRMYAQQGLPRYLATTRKMLEDKPLFHADEVRAPCLILRGVRDGIIPDTVARRLAAALPQGAFRRIEGAAHALQFSRPQEFVETALSYWGEAEAIVQ